MVQMDVSPSPDMAISNDPYVNGQTKSICVELDTTNHKIEHIDALNFDADWRHP